MFWCRKQWCLFAGGRFTPKLFSRVPIVAECAQTQTKPTPLIIHDAAFCNGWTQWNLLLWTSNIGSLSKHYPEIFPEQKARIKFVRTFWTKPRISRNSACIMPGLSAEAEPITNGNTANNLQQSAFICCVNGTFAVTTASLAHWRPFPTREKTKRQNCQF